MFGFKYPSEYLGACFAQGFDEGLEEAAITCRQFNKELKEAVKLSKINNGKIPAILHMGNLYLTDGRNAMPVCVNDVSLRGIDRTICMIEATMKAPMQQVDVREVLMPKIDRVIFNAPATIVLWKDGTKTVVKCQFGDDYSAELGLAMCIAKRALGNKGNYYDVLKKWLKPEDSNE